MTNLILESEILNNVLEDKSINRQEIIDIYQNSIKNSNDLFLTAQNFKKLKKKNNSVTFSKKAFFNIINLCKDTCSYCTYKAEPGEEKISLMSKQQIKDVLQLAKKYKCIEALFVTGEQPEKNIQKLVTGLKKMDSNQQQNI
jgi:Thiamine biosynthesis enzyme ThiH and related uncharacterized enzymes